MFDFLLLCILFSSSCCFWFLLLSYFCFFDFNYLSKNISEKFGNCKKNPKMKNAQKKDILTRAVSTGVLTNSVFFSFLCFFKFCIFAENTIKIGVSAKRKKGKKTQKKKKPSVKNWSKLALKTGPSMLRNKIGPVFNARNGSFVFVYFLFFLKNPLLSAGRTRFSKTKTKKTKTWTSFFNTGKGKNWTSF